MYFIVKTFVKGGKMKKRLSALVITAALIINSICVFAANTELLLINDKHRPVKCKRSARF